MNEALDELRRVLETIPAQFEKAEDAKDFAEWAAEQARYALKVLDSTDPPKRLEKAIEVLVGETSDGSVRFAWADGNYHVELRLPGGSWRANGKGPMETLDAALKLAYATVSMEHRKARLRLREVERAMGKTPT